MNPKIIAKTPFVKIYDHLVNALLELETKIKK